MGGNITLFVDNQKIEADKIDLSRITKNEFTTLFKKLFLEINNRHKKRWNSFLWKDKSIIHTGFVFNGSAEILFNDDIFHDDFIKYKPFIGDIDITIPIEKISALWKTLSKLEHSTIIKDSKFEIVYLGNNRSDGELCSTQINSLFKVISKEYSFNCQVDFEACNYVDNRPSAFSKFGHSSVLLDLSNGIKGVAHKYLMINLVRAISSDTNALIVTPASTPTKIRIKKLRSPFVKHLAFSVDLGLRVKLSKFCDDFGNHLSHDGKLLYKEEPTCVSFYQTNLNEIYSIVFPEQPTAIKIEFMKSYIGLLFLMSENLTEEKISETFKNLFHHLFAPGAQGLEKDCGDGRGAYEDRKIKMRMVEVFVEKFPFVGEYIDSESIVKYYNNYRCS